MVSTMSRTSARIAGAVGIRHFLGPGAQHRVAHAGDFQYGHGRNMSAGGAQVKGALGLDGMPKDPAHIRQRLGKRGFCGREPGTGSPPLPFTSGGRSAKSPRSGGRLALPSPRILNPIRKEGRSPVQVTVKDNNVDQALSALKKKMQREAYAAR